MFKKLFTNSFIYGLGPQIPKVISVMVLPFISAYLTAEDYGIYGVITAYIASITAFSTLGLNIIFYNTFVKHPNHYKKIWKQLYGFLILWAFVYALMQFIILYNLIPEEAEENKYKILFLLIIPTIFFGPISNIAIIYYQLKEKPTPIVVRSILSSIVTIFFNVIFIRFYKMGYMGWFYATFISSILWNISYWYPMLKIGITPNFNFKRNLIKRSLKVSLPTVVHSYGGFLLGSSNRLIMENIGVKIGDIGRYNFANSIASYGDSASLAMNQALGPMVVKEYQKKNEKMVLLLIRIMQITIFLLTFMIAIWSKEIVLLLMKNPSLQDCYYILIVIVMSYNYRPMYVASTSVYFFMEKTDKLWRISLIAGLLSVILNFIFIPIYGIMGAAVIYFIATTYIGYSGFFIKDFKLFSTENYKFIQNFIITIILLIIALLIVDMNFIIKIIISLLMIGISFFSLKKYYKLIDTKKKLDEKEIT